MTAETTDAPSTNPGWTTDVTNWLRGLCMGAADIVPGVSGGTVALILGHYERLVTAISHIDSKAIALLRQRRFREVWEYADCRFVLAIVIGMASGIVALASLMHYLLDHHLGYTYAAFTGLILASSWLVAQRIGSWSLGSCVGLVIGVFLAAWIADQEPLSGSLTPLNAFLSATVAICAMILPGISGAFILLLLGVYHDVTGLIKGLPKGDVSLDGIVLLACFGFGCLVGLLAFSRVLKWLLAHRHDATMAFLVGLMIGSLYKIWPFQILDPATADLEFKEQRFEHVWPSVATENPWLVLLIVSAAAGATLLLERLGDRLQASPPT